MKQLLIIANTPSPNTASLASSVVLGAENPAASSVNVIFKEPHNAQAQDVLDCDGIVIGTTENFAYMSGLIKDFFERIYYPCLEQKQGLPYALYIRAGMDGTGTRTGVEKIITGLCWRESHPCLILKGEFDTSFNQQCQELGTYMAVSMDAGII